MPFPPDVQTVTVTSGATGYRAPGGDAAVGSIRFTPSVSRVTSSEHGAIVLGSVNATLNASGGFNADPLLAIDADGFTPTGWTYRVDEDFTNAPSAAYNISLPASAAEVALPSIARTDESIGDYVVVTGPAGPAGPQGPPGDPASGAVTSVNSLTGAVTLNAAAVGADTAGASAAAQAAAATDATTKVTNHTGATDPHGDRAAASTALATHAAVTTGVHGIANTALLETATGSAAKVTTHAGAADPHGDRTWATGQFDAAGAAASAQAAAATDATGKVSAHVAAADPHGDRAWVTTSFAPLAGATFVGPVTVDDAAFSVLGTGKGYRFRPLGSRLDCEATGSDWMFSVFSGPAFDGAQRTYLRLEAGVQLAHAIGKWEFSASPDSGAVHTLDGAAGTAGFFGATPVLQPTVTGSWAAGTAGASLAAALATLGLIVNTTTA